MSNLFNNTTDLQAILDEVSSYKEIIETQDSLIAQLSTVLDGKAGGGSGSSALKTCTITINELTGSWFNMSYLDAEGVYQETGEIHNTATIDVPINSIIFFKYSMSPRFVDSSDTFVLMSDQGANPATFRFTGNGSVRVTY